MMAQVCSFNNTAKGRRETGNEEGGARGNLEGKERKRE